MTWVAALTAWTYWQVLFLQSWASFPAALSAASVAGRSIRPVWYGCFSAAMAFGVAWYVATHLGAAPPDRRRRTHRTAVAGALGTLCVAICYFVLVYRLLPIVAVALGDAGSTFVQTVAYGSAHDAGAAGRVVERFGLIGLLAVAVTAMQAWVYLPRLGGSRRRLTALLAALLVAGIAVPRTGLLETLPGPVPPAVLDSIHASPAARGLVLGEAAHRQDAEFAITTYLRTHGDDGTAIPLRDLSRNDNAVWRAHDDVDPRVLWCELCLLPGVSVWTLHGLPLRLATAEPDDDTPSLVLEIPRRATDARVYSPGSATSIRTVALEDVTTQVGPSDWLVLKIDFLVQMREVHGLLEMLRDHGVRRVDLAVVPSGYVRLPPEPPRIRLAPSGDAATYTPRERDRGRRRTVIIVKRYDRPEWRDDPRPRCNAVDRWSDYEDAWTRHAPDPPGSLPPTVVLPVDADTPYGQFVGVLQGAVTGGASTIEIGLRSPQP